MISQGILLYDFTDFICLCKNMSVFFCFFLNFCNVILRWEGHESCDKSWNAILYIVNRECRDCRVGQCLRQTLKHGTTLQADLNSLFFLLIFYYQKKKNVNFSYKTDCFWCIVNKLKQSLCQSKLDHPDLI